MNRKRWIGVGIVALVILLSGSALILASFSAMTSQMDSNSSLASSSGSQGAQPPLAGLETALYVSASARLKGALEAELIRSLQGRPEFGQIRLLKATTDRTDLPYLFVEVEPQDWLWTPVYARAGLKVSVAYSSDGDVSFRNTHPVQFFHEGDQPAVKRSGSYNFSDVSWGLISSPGYSDYLGRTVAAGIVNSLPGQ
jgi:hypothetical protein